MPPKETMSGKIKSAAISILGTLIVSLVIGAFSFYVNTVKEIATLKTQMENMKVAYNQEIEDLQLKINELKK